MSKPKIIVVSGSARAASDNRKVASQAAKALSEQDATVIHLDLNDFAAPMYDGDLEERSGVPESMTKLAGIVADADGIAISTPEYNGGIPPLLVNVFSWLSRVEGTPLTGKTAAVLAASPGDMGGARVAPKLRVALTDLGVTVIDGEVLVGASYAAFADDGSFANDDNTKAVADHMGKLVAALK